MKTLSILCPSRGRPADAERLVKSVLATARNPEKIEILFYIDDDDKTWPEYLDLAKKYPFVLTVRGPFIGVGAEWNKLAELCVGDVLMMGNDDVVYETSGWDFILNTKIANVPDDIYCFWFNDGINQEKHCAFPIISRKWYETLGYSFSPGFFHFFWNDTWTFEIAKKIGRTFYIGNVLVKHYHRGTFSDVEKDETHMRNRRDRKAIDDDRILFANTDDKRTEAAEKLKRVML